MRSRLARLIAPILSIFLTLLVCQADDHTIVDLASYPAIQPIPPWTPIYDGAVPDSQGSQDKDAPHVEVYLPKKGLGPTSAVIICPGGGYYGLALDHEGRFEANWLNAHGIAAFVFQYRLPAQGYRHPVPMHDGQRAIRWVRYNAAKFNIDPHKIGVMGFSAGGHVASTIETHFDNGNPTAADPVDRISCRPDFGILVYAVVTLRGGVQDGCCRAQLLGPNPDPALVAYLSNETAVTANTPPTILIDAADDPLVSILNSRDMYTALQKAGVPSELHEYPHGGHGFGFGATPDGSPKGWFDVDCYNWLKKMGFAS